MKLSSHNNNYSKMHNYFDNLVLSSITITIAFLTLFTWGPGTKSLVQGIKLQPEGREKYYWSGEQFVITCQNNNNIKNVKMRWIGPRGQDITEDRSQRVHTETAGPHGHRLIVMNASVNDDNGLYKCTLGGEGERLAKETIEFNLKIYKSIDFKNTRSNHTLAANDRAILTCFVDFDPDAQTATVSWLKDKKPIETYNDPAYSLKSYNDETQTSQLTISTVNRNHNGVYTCRATAVTTQLSQIREHDINVKIQFAPQFDQSSSVIWIERRTSHQQSLINTANNNNMSAAITASNYNAYPSGRPAYPHQQTARQRKMQHDQFGGNPNQQLQQQPIHMREPLDRSSSLVRVELSCTCQANPPASIIWMPPSRSGVQQFEMRKDNPPHVLEQPMDKIDEYNTTSVLVIGYDFDPQWPHKHDVYTCLATNTLGSAEKKFSIQEGILPPAYPVAPLKRYDAKTFLFEFTILPPPASQSSQQVTSPNIVPPVDMFRIRTDSERSDDSELDMSKMSVFSARPSPIVSKNSTLQQKPNHNQHQQNQQQQHQHYQQQQRTSNYQMLQRYNDGGPNHDQSDQDRNYILKLPQNYTVSLSMLPAGAQKLYLEAHNAVGWSPNSTYLGDFYIISGSSSLYQQVVSYSFGTSTVLNILLTIYIASYYLQSHQK